MSNSGVQPHSRGDFWDEYIMYVLKPDASPLEINQLVNKLITKYITSKPITYRRNTANGIEAGTVLIMNKKHRETIHKMCSTNDQDFIWNRAIKNSTFYVSRPSNLGGARSLYYSVNNTKKLVGRIYQCSSTAADNAQFAFHDHTYGTFWRVEDDRVTTTCRKPVKTLGNVQTQSRGPRYKDYANV